MVQLWLYVYKPYTSFPVGQTKLLVSCNPTLTSFLLKNTYPKVFFTLPTPNQHNTCMKHTFFNKKQSITIIFYPPIYHISGVQLDTSPIANGYRKLCWAMTIFAFVAQLSTMAMTYVDIINIYLIIYLLNILYSIPFKS